MLLKSEFTLFNLLSVLLKGKNKQVGFQVFHQVLEILHLSVYDTTATSIGIGLLFDSGSSGVSWRKNL